MLYLVSLTRMSFIVDINQTGKTLRGRENTQLSCACVPGVKNCVSQDQYLPVCLAVSVSDTAVRFVPDFLGIKLSLSASQPFSTSATCFRSELSHTEIIFSVLPRIFSFCSLRSSALCSVRFSIRGAVLVQKLELFSRLRFVESQTAISKNFCLNF